MARIPCFSRPPKTTPVLVPTGPAAEMLFEIPTDKKVAFITIDDGGERHPWALPMIEEAGVPVTLFLTTNQVRGHTEYFQQLIDTGLVEIQGHTVSHPWLSDLSYEQQKRELCDSTDQIERWFGQRPIFFRPPYGVIEGSLYDPQRSPTMKAAWECGLVAGFYWQKEAKYGRFEGGKVEPGDIILLHFRDRADQQFPVDFLLTLEAIKRAGLTPALLSDYVVSPEWGFASPA